MFDATKHNDVREITKEELEDIKLSENEYLLKVDDETGFMVKLNKNGSVPASFETWRERWNSNGKLPIYVIEEKYRRDWKFIGLRHGQSTAWVVLEHPYGFEVEINATAFEEIANKITMVNGRMVTPCYFQGKLKNAKLTVEKDDGQDFFYSLIKSVTDDKELIGRLGDIIEEERPDRVYGVIANLNN